MSYEKFMDDFVVRLSDFTLSQNKGDDVSYDFVAILSDFALRGYKQLSNIS